MVQPASLGVGRGDTKKICKKILRKIGCNEQEARKSLLKSDPILFDGACTFDDKWLDGFGWFPLSRWVLCIAWFMVVAWHLGELASNIGNIVIILKDLLVISFASWVYRGLSAHIWQRTFIKLFNKLDYRKNHLEWTRILLIIRSRLPRARLTGGYIGIFGNDNDVAAWLEELDNWQTRLKDEGDNRRGETLAEIQQLSQAVPEFTKERIPQLRDYYHIPMRIGFTLPILLIVAPIGLGLLSFLLEVVR